MPPEASHALPIIPDHTLVRELGRGGMASVYLAVHDELKRSVAIKVMEVQEGVSHDFVARFVREGQTVANLRHPRIVTIYHSNYKCAKPYIVMEFLPGGSLSERIKQGMSPEQAVAILRDLAEALGVAHRAGIVHRDLKPQNILFRDEHTPVLTDFGIARDLSDPNATQLTRVGTVVGSPRYMSPEQSMAKSLDARSDLYSLGVVFYEMLTGEPPYRARDVISLAMKHCTAPLPVLPPTESRYQPILDRLLAKTPEERFRDTDELIAALDALRQAPPIGTAVEPTVQFARAPLSAVAPGRTDETRTSLSAVAAERMEERTSLSAVSPEQPATPTGETTTTPPAPVPSATPRWRWTLGGMLLVALSAAGLYWWFNRVEDPASRVRHAAGSDRVEPHDSLAESLRAVRDGLAKTPDDPALRARAAALTARLAAERTPAEAATLATDLLAEGLSDEAQAVIAQGLRQAPDHARLRDLQALLEQQTARARAEQLAHWRDAVAQAMRAGDFSAALTALDRALALAPQDTALQQERTRIEQQAHQARAETLLQQARAALVQNDLAAALRLSQEGLASAPERRDLIELTARIEASMTRERELNAAIATVTARIGANALDEGARLAEAALARFPDDTTLLKLRGEALSLQRPAGTERIQEFARQAERLLAEERFAASLALVDTALERTPQQPLLTTLRSTIVERQTAAQRLNQQVEACATHSSASATRPPRARVAGLVAAVDCYRQLGAASPTVARAALEGLLSPLAAGFDAALAVAEVAAAEQALTTLEALCAPPATPPTAAVCRPKELAALRARLQERRALVPALTALPGGCFRMGSPPGEEGRAEDETMHRVCVAPFALGTHEVRIADFERFVKATGYRTEAERHTGNTAGCWAFDPARGDDAWGYHTWANWRQPRKAPPVDPAEPATCVSWHDVHAYIAWLNTTTGGHFRLPTEAEWEYAARAGTEGRWFWVERGNESLACRHANAADTGNEWSNGFPCNDGFEWAAPTGRFAPNPWGIYDVFGNASEWTCSEYDAHYGGDETRCAPTDATAPMVLRGGAWNSSPSGVRAAHRDRNYPEARYSFIGFRLARDGDANEQPGK